MVRDGRETSFPALGGRFRARGGCFGGGPEGPRIYKNIHFYSHPDIRHVEALGIIKPVSLGEGVLRYCVDFSYVCLCSRGPGPADLSFLLFWAVLWPRSAPGPR